MHWSFFIFGFLFGLRHAFDADHIAAVSVLSSRAPDKKTALLHGIFWGFGHTATLFIIGILVFVFGVNIPPAFSSFFEFAVAIMLIGFGAISCLQGIRSAEHTHPPFGLHRHPNPSFLVGIIHGLAGSAAILVFIISAIKSPFLGLLYILIFGLGTIISMALLTFIIGLSVVRIKKYAGFAAGVFSFGLGISMLFSSKFL